MRLRFFDYQEREVSAILAALKTDNTNAHKEKLLEISDKIFLFDGIAKEDIQLLTKNVKINKYKEGDYILTQGDHDKIIHFLLAGEASVTINDIIEPLAILKGGSLIGEMGFISGEERSANIVAGKGAITVSFEIDMKMFSEKSSYPYAMLYYNISMDLVNKVNNANKKNINS